LHPRALPFQTFNVVFLRYFKQKSEADKKNKKKAEKDDGDDKEDETLGRSKVRMY
jgi:hypothetical protein